MAAKKQSTSPKKYDTKTIVTIAIAVLGLAGTLLAALITGMFNFLSTKAQIELPISATQTAEFKAAPPTATHLPIPSPTQTPTSPSLNWQDYLEIEKYVQCNEIILLPQEIDYSTGIVSAKVLEAISQGLANKDILTWAKVPEVSQDMYGVNQATIAFDINNIASPDWVEVDKNITVSINTETEIPDKIQAVRVGGGCGASGYIRVFPSLNLETNFEQYIDKTTYTEADFFKLEMGEFETFQVPFTCQTPGYYRLALDMPIQIRSVAGEMQTTAAVLCPQEVTVWFYNLMTNELEGIRGSYIWDGSSYVSK